MRNAMQLLAMSAALLAATGAWGDDKKAEVSGDLKKFQGTWAGTSSEGGESRWAFDGDQMKSHAYDEDYTCRVSLDEKATPHPTIDVEIVEGPEGSVGKKSPGIYKLDGDSLTICVAAPGVTERPTELKEVAGEAYLFTLKREDSAKK